MTRAEILRNNKMYMKEDFSQREIDILNANEDYIRKLFFDKLNNLNIRKSKDFQDMNSETGTITRLVNNIVNKDSTYYDVVYDSITSLLTSKFENANEILNELLDENLKYEIEDSNSLVVWKLSDMEYSENTKNFLLDLYKMPLTSVGRNSLGKGEVLFSTILKGSKLSSHTENSSTSATDIILSDNNTVVVKTNGSRLDGNIQVQTAFDAPECFKKALENNLGVDEDTGNKKLYKSEYSTEPLNLYKIMNRSFKSNGLSISDPSIFTFSLKNIRKTYKVVISTLRSIKDQLLTINVQEFFNEYLESIYNEMYKDYFSASSIDILKDKYIRNITEKFMNWYNNDSSVSEIGTINEINKAEKLLRLVCFAYLRAGGSNHPGYLILATKTSDDIKAFIVNCKLNDETLVKQCAELLDNKFVSIVAGSVSGRGSAPRISILKGAV